MDERDFYEADEPVEELVRTFERGVPGRTRDPLVIHVDAPMVRLDTVTPDGRVWVSPKSHYEAIADCYGELPLPIIPIPGTHHALDAQIKSFRIEDGVVWVGCDVRATGNGIRYLSALELGALRLSADFDTRHTTVETYTASGDECAYACLSLFTRWRLRAATFLRADSPDSRIPLPKISWPDV